MEDIKNRKLADFLQGRQLLQSEFHSASSMDIKFQVLRSKINLLNPHSLKPNKTHKHIKSENEESLKESEDLYFRQLNKMCQGQEQYDDQRGERCQINKKVEKDKMFKVKTKNQKKKHCFVKSVHQVRNYEWEEKKFIKMPNFHEILKGCSIGYAGQIQKNSLKKAGKVFKQSIFQKQNKNEIDSSTIKKFLSSKKNKRTKMQNKVRNLKSKAKHLYNVSFIEERTQFKQSFCPLNSIKKAQENGISATQEKQLEVKRLRKLNNSEVEEPIENSVPAFLMKTTQKDRPASVPLFAKFRFKSLYFRV